MIRINSGLYKGRVLRGGKSPLIRPTMSKVKLTFFDILQTDVKEKIFLDGFAGSGNIGLEALSRGAASAVFVERDRTAARLVEANCDGLCGGSGRARVLQRPALRAIQELTGSGLRFSLAWADPPFESWQEGLEALVAAFSAGVLAREATACLECPARADVQASLPDWLRVERDLAGGASRVVLLRHLP